MKHLTEEDDLQFYTIGQQETSISAFYLVVISIVCCIVALAALFLNKSWKSVRKYPVFNSTFTLNTRTFSKLVKALIVCTWPSFYQQKSTLTRTKLKHVYFRTCINNWLQYKSNIAMFYSLICITNLNPFLIACNLATSDIHLHRVTLVANPVICHEWAKDQECLRQVICDTDIPKWLIRL